MHSAGFERATAACEATTLPMRPLRVTQFESDKESCVLDFVQSYAAYSLDTVNPHPSAGHFCKQTRTVMHHGTQEAAGTHK